MVPAPAPGLAPEPKLSPVTEFTRGGPMAVPVPDVRQEGRYVYGIIQAREPITFRQDGHRRQRRDGLHRNSQDIAAVVSHTSVFIFDPTRENALAHEHVIETVMKKHTIIPMSFGTVFRTDDDIREVLKSIYPSLKDVLKQMAGKLEFGLKVNWDRDQIIEEIKRETKKSTDSTRRSRASTCNRPISPGCSWAA